MNVDQLTRNFIIHQVHSIILYISHMIHTAPSLVTMDYFQQVAQQKLDTWLLLASLPALPHLTPSSPQHKTGERKKGWHTQLKGEAVQHRF